MTHHVRIIYRFEPRGEGVRVWTYFGWLPRSWWAGLLLRVGMSYFRRRLEKLIQEVAPVPADEVPVAFLAEPDRLEPEAERRLGVLDKRLRERGMNEEVVDALMGVVREGDPVDVARLQPRALAHRWHLPEKDVLRCFLHATRVGLLDLSWDVICPHCRGVRKELKNLGEIPEGDSCEPCRIEFGTDGPNAIEVTFHVHPSVREVEKQVFCSAQAAAKRHIEVQQVLAAGEEAEVRTALAAGRYRLRRLGELDLGYLDVAEDGPTEVVWTAREEADDKQAGPAPRLRLVNDSDREQIFIVEVVNWADEALLPGHLFSFQEFHDLFSEEYLGADVHLSVGEQTILFTDIVGSTALYIDRGDPEAFVAVRKHFTEVYAIVTDHDGAVIKTIGDATMASFGDALAAMKAAEEMMTRFSPDREDTTIRIRASVNTGVCIAVNLNSNIDYFGNTVNLAAKLQLCAGAGDVAFTEATRAAPGVAAYLEERGAPLQEVAFDFKPLGETITVHRWALHADDESEQTRRAT
jgi:class 3 adenylate cyclase